MRYWNVVGDDSPPSDHEREFARIWKGLPKFVFSSTLETVEATLRS